MLLQYLNGFLTYMEIMLELESLLIRNIGNYKKPSTTFHFKVNTPLRYQVP